MSNTALKDLCKKTGAAIRGTKADVIERLLGKKKKREVPSDHERKANQRERKAKSRAKKKDAEILQSQKDEEESNKNLTQFSRKAGGCVDGMGRRVSLYTLYETSPEKLPAWQRELIRQDELSRAQKEAEAARKATWRADPKNRAYENSLNAQRMRKKRGALGSEDRKAWEASHKKAERNHGAESAAKAAWRGDPKNRARENALNTARMRKKRGPPLKSKERAAWEASQRTPEEQAAYKSRMAEKRAEAERNHRAELPPDLLSSGCGGPGRGNGMSGCGCQQPTQKKIFEITGPGGHPVHASAAIEPSMSHFLMVCPLRLRESRMPQQMCYLERDQPHDPLLFDVAFTNNNSGYIPQPWQVRIDASSGRLYYYHFLSGITQWERPTYKPAEDGVDPEWLVQLEAELSPARKSKKVIPSPFFVSDLLKDPDTVEIRINGISVCRLLRDCTHTRATIQQTAWGDSPFGRLWRKPLDRSYGKWEKKWEKSLIITHHYHFLHGETVWGWEEKFCVEVIFRGPLSDDLISGAEEIIAKWGKREHWDGHHLYKFLEENGVTAHDYWTGMNFDRIVFQQFAWKKGNNNTLWKAVNNERRDRNDSDRSARYGNDWGFCSWKCYADFKRKGKKFKSQNPHVSVPDILDARTSADCKWCQKYLSEFKKFGRKAGDAVPRQLREVEAGQGKKVAGECNEQNVPDEQLSAGLLIDGSHDEDERMDGMTAEI
jgi:hypothetical protein